MVWFTDETKRFLNWEKRSLEFESFRLTCRNKYNKATLCVISLHKCSLNVEWNGNRRMKNKKKHYLVRRRQTFAQHIIIDLKRRLFVM